MDAKFEGTEKLDGLEIYKYHVTVPDTAAEIADGINGTYSTDKVMLVEPMTGSIVNQIQHEVRTLEDGTKVLDLKLNFTDDQVAAGIKDGKANVKKLNLFLNQVGPITAIAGGLLFLAGLALVIRAARQRSTMAAEDSDA